MVVLAIVSPVHAQDAQNDPVFDLLQQVQGAASTGDADAFQALRSPAAPRAPLVRFTDRWFSRATTAVTIQEIERQILGESGRRVLVEALVEAGAGARVATWRLDLLPGPDGWRISDAATVGAIEGLYRLTLDPTRQFRASNLVIAAEDLELLLPEGDVFVADVAAGVSAAVLLGRGEMIFHPAPEAERRQLERFNGEPVLRAEFDAAFIRFHPDEAAARLPTERLSSVPVDPDRFERGRRIFEDELVKSFVVDLPGLSLDPWSLLPPAGDLVAEVQTRRHGTLTYIHSTADAEDVAVFDRERRKNISTYASRERLAARGPFYDEDDRSEYDVLDYNLDVRFTPARVFFEGQALLRIRVSAGALSSFSVRLASTLVPLSVTSSVHGRLLYLRVRNQNRLVLNLPSRAVRGDEFTIAVRYAGRLEPQAPDRENLQVDQEPGPTLPGFQPPQLLLRPQPAWIYSSRSNWYPQPPVSDYGPAMIRFTVPDEFGVACSGVPVAGSPVNLREFESDAGRLFVFAARRPIRYLACVVSRFDERETRMLAVPDGHAVLAAAPGASAAPAGSEASVPSNASASAAVPAATVGPAEPATRVRAMPLHLMNATRDRNRARDTLERAERIVGFYASVMGDVPYPELTLAVVESLVPGGHAPAHLVMLRQPLLQSPYVWGDDPASFEDFDDFFLAHELAHQWWGQAVGWQNYHEQWLSEAFAQYFAALYAEHDRGPGTFREVLQQLTRWTRSESDQGPVYLGYRVGHLDSDARAFRAIIYNKGAIVLHMLRELIGDEAFFGGLRRFYAEERFTKAGTADLRAAMEQAAERSLAVFFERWIFGEDLPVVDAVWSVDDRTLRLALRQRDRTFQVPVPVSLLYEDGTRRQITVRLHEARVEIELPIDGRLRTIEINPDETIPIEVHVSETR